MKIKIDKNRNNQYLITINNKIQTKHSVLLTDEVYNKLTNGNKSKEELLYFSFNFLLEREPNTQILSQFELSAISDYFPEYYLTIRKWCKFEL